MLLTCGSPCQVKQSSRSARQEEIQWHRVDFYDKEVYKILYKAIVDYKDIDDILFFDPFCGSGGILLFEQTQEHHKILDVPNKIAVALMKAFLAKITGENLQNCTAPYHSPRRIKYETPTY